MTESRFSPARVMAPIVHPIELGRHGVTFDGVLWSALDAHLCDPVRAKQALGNYLSHTDGVAHASSLRFGIKPSQRLIATTRKTVGVMRSESDLTSEQFHPHGRGGKYPKILVGGGPYRNRINEHQLYHAPWAVFYIHGDAEAIVALLNFYIDCVGVNAGSGSGTVGSWRWEPTDHDRSLVDSEGQPARALPQHLFESLSDQPGVYEPAAIEPPYHVTDKQLCAMPERVVRELIH